MYSMVGVDGWQPVATPAVATHGQPDLQVIIGSFVTIAVEFNLMCFIAEERCCLLQQQ